jgi:hypothetical protein
MNKKTVLPLTLCLVLLVAARIGANAAGTASVDLSKADWSVKATHNLAANPPSLDAVQDFYDRATGVEMPLVKVCEFRFADLRNSGNLSLIAMADPGNGECGLTQIFDRTPTGFDVYAGGGYAQDLAHSVLDLNHDGRHQLLLWSDLALYAKWSHFHSGLSCSAEWPLIFAWTGGTYSNVSDQYKDYYRGYLKSVNVRLAAYSSVLAPAAAPTANPAPAMGGAAEQAHGELPPGVALEVNGGIGSRVQVAPVPTPEGGSPAWAVQNEASANYPCTEIEAAKTEAFLGTRSASTMSAAIKDSESDDPDRRIAAAVVFSDLGTGEAEQDLKTLSNDADPKVAAVAKTAASFGEDPPRDARTMRRNNTFINLTEPPQSKPY